MITKWLVKSKLADFNFRGRTKTHILMINASLTDTLCMANMLDQDRQIAAASRGLVHLAFKMRGHILEYVLLK